MTALDPRALALVLVDMQNDFLHTRGAYGRAGQTSPAIAALPSRLLDVAQSVRAAGGWIVSTHFTLVPGRGGAPLISPHLSRLRPFLGDGDFAPGSIGHDIVEELKPVDFRIEKVAYDAFYMSRLEWVLSVAGLETLAFGGIVTNGGVESTVRSAHVRGYEIIVLSDGCAAFSAAAHERSMSSMATIARSVTCAEFRAMLD